jgi:hypothetical protein
MKTFYSLILLAFLGFAVLSCSDTSNPIVTPVDKASTTNSTGNLDKDNDVLHSLTGSAHTYNILYNDPNFGLCIILGPKQKDGFYNVFTVNAIEHKDGTITGKIISQFQGKIPDDLTYEYVEFLGKVEIKIIQLMVDETGKIAKIVGEITKWDGPQLPWWFAMAFIDNGEGKTSTSRDEISSWWFSDQESDRDLWLSQGPQEFIDWQWAIIEPFNLPNMGPTVPIDNGNIQVR